MVREVSDSLRDKFNQSDSCENNFSKQNLPISEGRNISLEDTAVVLNKRGFTGTSRSSTSSLSTSSSSSSSTRFRTENFILNFLHLCIETVYVTKRSHNERERKREGDGQSVMNGERERERERECLKVQCAS